MDAGRSFACAVMLDETVRCWGDNGSGELGTTGPATPTPQVVPGISTAVSVSAGGDHACAVLTDHTIRCWGRNLLGELGAPTAGDSSATPVTVQGITTAVSVSAGDSFTCAVLADHTVRCWGFNGEGQIGTTANMGTGNPTFTPNPVPGITTATAVAAGYYHACAVLADATMRCWGSNSYGQLGTSTGVGSSTATPVTPTSVAGVTAVATGYLHTCAVTSNGSVTCFGENEFGQLGRTTNAGTQNANPSAHEVSGITTAVGISGGIFHTCALLRDGTSECWGQDVGGELGNRSADSSNPNPSPLAVTGLAGAVTITAGWNYSCALAADDTLRCWGSNFDGALGRDQDTQNSNPHPDEAAVPLPPIGGRAADLSLTAVANGTTALRTGHTSQVLLTVHNDGPDAASPQVWVAHDSALPVATTSNPSAYAAGTGFGRWTPGPVAAGASATLLVTVAASGTGAHALTAEVGASDAADPDSLPGNGAAAEDDQAAVTFGVTTTADVLRLTATHRGRAVTATARLLVTRAAPRTACAGKVTIAFKQGKKTAKRKAALKLAGDGSCTARARYSARKSGKVTIRASYPGSAVLAPISGKPTRVTVR